MNFVQPIRDPEMHLLHQEVFKRAKHEELYAIRDRYQFRAPHIRYSAAESERRETAILQSHREENEKEKENRYDASSSKRI